MYGERFRCVLKIRVKLHELLTLTFMAFALTALPLPINPHPWTPIFFSQITEGEKIRATLVSICGHQLGTDSCSIKIPLTVCVEWKHSWQVEHGAVHFAEHFFWQEKWPKMQSVMVHEQWIQFDDMGRALRETWLESSL